MKKLLITLMLTIISTGAMAEWTLVGESPSSGGYDVYADPSTIRKTDNGVRMWTLFDYKTVQNFDGEDSHLSRQILNQYDCKDEKIKLLSTGAYSGNMSSGDVILAGSGDGNWRYVSTGTIDETTWEIACGKSN